MLTLMISDVPGDDPGMIGSGPTVGEASTPAEALAIIDRWQVAVPDAVRAVLAQGSGIIPPGDPRLSRVENHLYAAPAQSLAAAAALARQAGCKVRLLGDALEGEAREEAARQAAEARRLQQTLPPGAAPILLLSGGELTVTRRGSGIGGPNAEFCLALAIALDGTPGIHALACDTDGIDGAAEVAGAVFGPDILSRARAAGVDPAASLAANDAHSFFAATDGQVVTGPTLTNVNDFRAILIEPRHDQ